VGAFSVVYVAGGLLNKVKFVEKLPHPYFPLKKINYQHGGQIEVGTSINQYHAVYTPTVSCELKAISIVCSAYNIEDTYDIMVGDRFLVRGSHVKEMAEKRILEVFEVVGAGQSISLMYHNNSGLSKIVLYDIITLIDTPVNSTALDVDWSFTLDSTNVFLDSQEQELAVVYQPNYVNMTSVIDSFDIVITNSTTQLEIGTLVFDGTNVTSTYVETNPTYQSLGLLGRVNVIGITGVNVHDTRIEVMFKNLSAPNVADLHPIEIGLSGLVTNIHI
jgi:hypothetical protein